MRKITARHRVLALALVGSSLVPLLPALDGGALAKQEVEVDTFTVADSRHDQLHPRIDGDRVVWQDYRDIGAHSGDEANADIFVYDIEARDEFKVTDNHSSSRPDVDGEIVVYTDKREGDLDIRGYNVRTDESFWVARRSGSNQDRAAIDGEIVVWQDDRDGNWDIRGRDLDGDEFWVSRREGNQVNPRISGRTVVWEDDRDGCCDIYMRDLDSGDVRRVTDSNDAHEPDVAGDWIVYRRGDGDRISIYAYNVESGEAIRLNETRDDTRGRPSVGGRVVVWEDRRNGDSYNVVGYDLESRTEFLITRGDADEREPAVSGSRVVWTDHRGPDIRGARLNLSDLSTPTPTATATVTVPAPPVGPPVPQGPCTYVLGFRWLRDRIVEREGDIVGQCLENEWHNADNGDGLQRTSARGDGAIGMFAWRKADNWTAYTDGHTTWLWGPCGLQKRLNSGPYFGWEGRLGAPCM